MCINVGHAVGLEISHGNSLCPRRNMTYSVTRLDLRADGRPTRLSQSESVGVSGVKRGRRGSRTVLNRAISIQRN